MTIPIIALMMARTQNKYRVPMFSITEAYTQAIIRAGAAPLMIPLGLSGEYISTILSKVDGILFTGGGDVHPQYYNSQDHPLVSDVDTDRDEIEILLLHKLISIKKPFLGICRGLQVINIALGGTLFEDIADQMPNSIRHNYHPEFPRQYLAHSVTIKANSRLFQIINKEALKVNSLHHQGICMLAPDLVASAFAPDGLIEAIELPNHPFGLAVQWHPEWLPAMESMNELFQAFVIACTQYGQEMF